MPKQKQTKKAVPVIETEDIFFALGDPTRSEVVKLLASGPKSVSELANYFEMSLPSFIQHLNTLENAGVIRSVKEGRVRTCHLLDKQLKKAEKWLDKRRGGLERTKLRQMAK